MSKLTFREYSKEEIVKAVEQIIGDKVSDSFSKATILQLLTAPQRGQLYHLLLK